MVSYMQGSPSFLQISLSQDWFLLSNRQFIDHSMPGIGVQ